MVHPVSCCCHRVVRVLVAVVSSAVSWLPTVAVSVRVVVGDGVQAIDVACPSRPCPCPLLHVAAGLAVFLSQNRVYYGPPLSTRGKFANWLALSPNHLYPLWHDVSVEHPVPCCCHRGGVVAEAVWWRWQWCCSRRGGVIAEAVRWRWQRCCCRRCGVVAEAVRWRWQRCCCRRGGVVAEAVRCVDYSLNSAVRHPLVHHCPHTLRTCHSLPVI